MADLQQQLVSQLDTLVPFLALAHREGFELIEEHAAGWLGDVSLANYENYRVQVAHSAFLLGYSYTEAFLANLARAIYRHRPKMLPGDRQLSYRDVLSCQSPEEILETMVEREIRGTFHKSMKEIGQYFQTKFSLPWKDPEQKIEAASLIRNCMMHNNSIVDARLADLNGSHVGEKITLHPEDVHELGLAARALSRELFTEATRRHLSI